MTLAQRSRDTRDELQWRELCAVEIGAQVIYDGAPRRATVRRWLEEDEFRERYAAALDRYRMTTIEAAIAEADESVKHRSGLRRVAAMKRQVTARAQWLRAIAARAAANDNKPSSRHGWAWPDHPGVVAESKQTPGSSPPRTAGGVRFKKRGGEDDDKKSASDSPGTSASSVISDSSDGAPDYAPEDARYRPRVAPPSAAVPSSPPPAVTAPDCTADAPHRDVLLLPMTDDDIAIPPRPMRAAAESIESKEPGGPAAHQPPSIEDTAEDVEADKPRDHRLPLTVAEEEAKARAGRRRRPAKPTPIPPEFDKFGNRIVRDPPGAWRIRFDTGVTVSNERRHDRTTGWDDYDPFA
jgi:hypothetical protein